METVHYKPIKGFPGYLVGDDGSVWSCLKQGKKYIWSPSDEWRKLKPSLGKGTKGGGRYPSVVLKNESGTRPSIRIHRLVLEAFVGPCPEGMECRHLDGDPRNNRLENLKWGTKSENGKDRILHGTCYTPVLFGENNTSAKLTNNEVLEIKVRVLAGESPAVIWRDFKKVKRQTIWRIAKDKSWKHIQLNLTRLFG